MLIEKSSLNLIFFEKDLDLTLMNSINQQIEGIGNYKYKVKPVFDQVMILIYMGTDAVYN